MLVRDVILYFALKYKGDWNLIYKAIKDLEDIDVDEYDDLKKKLKANFITILDNEYPEKLKNISRPPYVLFYYGNIDLLNCNNTLAVVGSREISSYGKKATNKILNELKGEPLVLVSGLAKGTDTIAHKVALENEIPTIAILGTGIDTCYPQENFMLYDEIKEKGLLMSEYPFKESVPKEAFSFRNRIITGLSKFVFVPDIHERSGTLVSVRYALSQGKDIFTLPYPIFEDNLANKLIQEGAKLITSGEDIVEEFE